VKTILAHIYLQIKLYINI